MHIFIDETGSFTGIGQPNSISMIGALIVPDARLGSLEREYRKIRRLLPQQDGEVKGKSLGESDIAKLIPILHHHETLFEVIGVDLGLHSEQGVITDQLQRANAMTNALTEKHHKTLVDAVWKARSELESYSLQLNIQSAVIFELVPTLLEHATMYFSQRRPTELAKFNWVIDAKGDNEIPTPWEKWWSTFIKPALQTRLALKPMNAIRCGDYSYMTRFHISELSQFHKDLFAAEPESPPPLDLGMILSESIRFSYFPEPGLELIDILVNATRRALRGNLQPEGWKGIASLMIRRKPQNILLVSLDDKVPKKLPLPYGGVVKAFDVGNRSMLTASNRQRKW